MTFSFGAKRLCEMTFPGSSSASQKPERGLSALVLREGSSTQSLDDRSVFAHAVIIKGTGPIETDF